MSRSRVLWVIFLAVAASYASLPQGWQACKLKSAGYEECLKTAINIALKSLRNGNKQFGVGPIDPLKIEAMKIDQGTGPVNMRMEFQDMDVYGLSNCQINAIKNDWKTIEASALCLNNNITSNYKLSGKILTFPIAGEGNSHVYIGEMTAHLSGKLKEIDKGGKKYFDLLSYSMDVNSTKIKFNFENLFNGNKELSESMNTFMNENADLIMKEVQPALSKAFSQVYAQVAKKIFSKIPSDELNIA